jgi:hypothetical protein
MPQFVLIPQYHTLRRLRSAKRQPETATRNGNRSGKIKKREVEEFITRKSGGKNTGVTTTSVRQGAFTGDSGWQISGPGHRLPYSPLSVLSRGSNTLAPAYPVFLTIPILCTENPNSLCFLAIAESMPPYFSAANKAQIFDAKLRSKSHLPQTKGVGGRLNSANIGDILNTTSCQTPFKRSRDTAGIYQPLLRISAYP